MDYEIGIIGLGVMGRNLLLNIADHDIAVAGYDNDAVKVEDLKSKNERRDVFYTSELKEFIACLKKPRSVILLVPAGPAVDSVIDSTLQYLNKDDLLIDLGNSYYKDTDLREIRLRDKGIYFMGIGISGGEEGARNGASIMPGGLEEVYERVKPVLEAVAAKVNGIPCVTYLGPHSSGHFVKMVHNGIEYGLMQLISESYALMKLVLNFSDDDIKDTYVKWNSGKLNSFLIEISAGIFEKVDERTGNRLIDKILDVSRQKGTGMWASQSAMELQVPVPVIDIAVSMRNLSALEEERAVANKIYNSGFSEFEGDKEEFLVHIQKSLYVSFIITYAQGFCLLSAASGKYGYRLDPVAISRIWRGGCIIRSSLLEDINKAFHANSGLPNLLLDPKLSQQVSFNHENLRSVIAAAASQGVPVPALMSSLAYLDSYSSSWLPANLIQAQRDYFGGHSYERNDTKGTYHTEWIKTLG